MVVIEKYLFNANCYSWLIDEIPTNGKSTNTNIGKSTNQERKKKNLKKDELTLFEKIWISYPKKVGKVVAEKSFKKLKVDDELLEVMLQAIEVQKQSKQWQDKQFIPNPVTWLNQRRREDETEEEQKEVLKQTDVGLFKY